MQALNSNHRDVGLALAALCSRTNVSVALRAGRLLRGPDPSGRSLNQLGHPRTVINLRMEPSDPARTVCLWGASGDPKDAVRIAHCPKENSLNAYDTASPDVRKWLISILHVFEEPLAFPVLIHCRAGRDRTGVVIATLLLVLGVPKDTIVQEFLLSSDAKEENIRLTLQGIAASGGIEQYVKNEVDLNLVRQNLQSLGEAAHGEELQHLRAECNRLFRHAKAAEKSHDTHEASCAQEALRMVCLRGSTLAPQELAFHAGAGWASARLGRLLDAEACLKRGIELAEQLEGDSRVANMMSTELQQIEGLLHREPDAGPAVVFWKPGEKNGYLSNWYSSPFASDGVSFLCCEQYIMWSKAQLFQDFGAAKKILEANEPGKQKALGRAVKNFKEPMWEQHRQRILEQGLHAKFSQNQRLQDLLLSTAPARLAEASPKDNIYGIGMSPDDPDVQNPGLWQGQNLLGNALEKVRQELLLARERQGTWVARGA
eukprot:gnl/MRDRNA2_/MRDRNA2_94063_c0_seq1.p1 gnl/MRDRNA2_/MRDRNA2_94063_c0~~gnl/MRDRNA2_/MRDRNA2_94063_c0_seq1.p1  ORF type:complete len:487 (+),score=106.06 gnl/MRDRNA2_/MRDRNA2_94063_c0_seq1:84-1544(+)